MSSIELQHVDIRNRYSFKQGRALHEVFAADLANALKAALQNMVPGERIISMPDFKVTIPGVVLGGLRILYSKAENGKETIMMRVREYVGAIKSAFRFDPSLAVDTATMRERIAVEVLRDIVNPLLDILSIARDTPPEVIDNNSAAIRGQLKRMSMRQDEINFYVGLLKRYIAGCRSDAEGQTANGIDMETVPGLGRS
ncbi:hypothetical protein [uncultured Litoreibacter sp.]|uniref:hypothetical protein n=1 Tax=uncultured Litoreibacter sp. TaxID=1392394 RepID=UPI00262EE050|nr:hypothetical protein [uncultured Litoreibacter sp.]